MTDIICSALFDIIADRNMQIILIITANKLCRAELISIFIKILFKRFVAIR